MELDEKEVRFLSDLVMYSNQVFGRKSSEALEDGIPVPEEGITKEFDLMIDTEGEYGDAIGSLKRKEVLNFKEELREMHRKKEGFETREIEEKKYIVLERPEVLEEIDEEPIDR